VFLFFFLIFCCTVFYNVVMEISIVKYSMVDIFLFFLIIEIVCSNVLFVSYLVPETLRCIG